LGLNRNIFCLFLGFLYAGHFYCQNSDQKFDLRENIRIPDKWELILETATENDEIVFSKMDSFRRDGYSKLLEYNHTLCLCEEKWRSYLTKYDLLETALYLPLALNNGSQIDCSLAEDVFENMSDFSGKSSEYIEHLRGICDGVTGFENFLYDYRISIRLIENLELPKNCLSLKKTHIVLEGQTLYRLSVIYNVSVENIQRENNLGESTQINSGSVLVIP